MSRLDEDQLAMLYETIPIRKKERWTRLECNLGAGMVRQNNQLAFIPLLTTASSPLEQQIVLKVNVITYSSYLLFPMYALVIGRGIYITRANPILNATLK